MRNTRSSGPTSKAPLGGLERAYPTFHRLAAAQAVLAPLCDLQQVTFPPRLDTVEALRALWRSRLHGLRAAGWGPVQRPLDFAYAANCPPHSFARDGSGHKPCNKYRACPFCHGIHASLLFENVCRAVRRQSPPKNATCCERPGVRPEPTGRPTSF